MTPLVVTGDYAKLYWARNRALLSGTASQESFLRSNLNVAGNCLDPVRFELFARPARTHGRDVFIKPGSPLPISIEMVVRCRKCSACIQAKKHHWRFRAISETQRARRTWFLTLTLRPAVWDGLMKRGVSRSGAGASPLECGIRELGREFQLALKRLRKSTKAKLRFMSALEWHKSGVPHYHVLLHCVDRDVTYREIRPFWTLGFVHLTLIKRPSDGADYVTKYLVKSLGARVPRVRASLGYGEADTDLLHSGGPRHQRAPRVTTPPAPLRLRGRPPDASLARGVAEEGWGSVLKVEDCLLSPAPALWPGEIVDDGKSQTEAEAEASSADAETADTS